MNSESYPFAGQRVCFTGTLASMTHEQAGVLVIKQGGEYLTTVSRRSTMLVVGEEGWPLEDNGHPSQKWRNAMQYNEEGVEIRIVDEADWLHMLQLSGEKQQVKRLYTPAMLSAALNVPVNVIRNWEHKGLIRAEKRVNRLPYFSFSEATMAKRLSGLLNSGIESRQIEQSLTQLRKIFPKMKRPIEQLELLSDSTRVIIRDDRGLIDPTCGQRLLDFEDHQEEPPAESLETEESFALPLPHERISSSPSQPVDWVVEGCRFSEDRALEEAVQCFRRALIKNPCDAEANFYLADALYAMDLPHAAIERFLAAIEHDPQYVEAWLQLGCLWDQLGQQTEAEQAFRQALALHEDYPDAHFHLAELLHRENRTEEALEHWRRYLNFDNRGPWSEMAIQRLEQAGDDLSWLPASHAEEEEELAISPEPSPSAESPAPPIYQIYSPEE